MVMKKLLKFLILDFFILGLAKAFAGGPEIPVQGPPLVARTLPETSGVLIQPAFVTKMYIEGDLGYASVDWRNKPTPFDKDDKLFRSKGGLTGILDLGYQLARNWSLEAGVGWLPKVEGTSNGIISDKDTALVIDDWFSYLAGRLDVPLWQNVDIFGKVGISYRDVKFGVTDQDFLHVGSHLYLWKPIFTIGLKCQFDDFWEFHVEYNRLNGESNDDIHRDDNGDDHHRRRGFAPPANIISVGFGYRFAF